MTMGISGSFRATPLKGHLVKDVAVHSCRKNVASLRDRKSTRLNSSHTVISYAVFCLKKKKNYKTTKIIRYNGKYCIYNKRNLSANSYLELKLLGSYYLKQLAHR